MAGIGVVVNPYAGHNRALRDRAERFAEMVGADGVVRQTGSLEQTEEVAREFRRAEISILAVCGGDGSFFRTLSAMVRTYAGDRLPDFLPLRAGSMNTIAGSVGCRHGSPERVLAHTLADYRAGRPLESAEWQLIAVAPQHYGFMVGAGVIVNFLRLYYEARSSKGKWAAAKLLGSMSASALFQGRRARELFQPNEAVVECDGKRVPLQQFNLIYGSTITDIGLGFKLTYLATREPGFFHLVAGAVQARQVAWRLWRVRRGRPLEIEGLYEQLARRVKVEFARPTQYMIDGDIMGAVASLEVTTGPKLTVIRR